MRTAAEEWLGAAEDDLETVKEIIENAHLTHIVAFHAQQCIEKCFKAILEYHKLTTPNIHNLLTLRQEVIEYFSENIDSEMLDRLNQLYIDARYPGEIGLLPEGKPTIEEAKQFSGFAKDILLRAARHIRNKGMIT